MHQDSASLTAIVLLRRHNVHANSGANRVWSLEQPSGKPSARDETVPGRLLLERTLLDRWEALFVRDRLVKHEVLPLLQAEPETGGAAERDVVTPLKCGDEDARTLGLAPERGVAPASKVAYQAIQ